MTAYPVGIIEVIGEGALNIIPCERRVLTIDGLLKAA
jgi:hypothetical protein